MDIDERTRMLEVAKQKIMEEVKAIEDGEVVCEDVSYEKERVVVTKIKRSGKSEDQPEEYGYMVYRPYHDKPYCYIRSGQLFTDFHKGTDVAGNPLPYTGYQSTIIRNLTGRFSEYVHDFNFDMYSEYIRSAPSDKVQFTSSVRGHMETDPSQILFIDWKNQTITRLASVHITPKGEVSLDCGNVKPDGKVDVEEMIRWIAEEVLAEAFIRGEKITAKEAQRIAEGICKDRLKQAEKMGILGYLKREGTSDELESNIIDMDDEDERE